MLKWLKEVKLKWYDIFLLPWIGFGIPIILEQNKFVSHSNLLGFTKPFWVFSLFFIISVVSIFCFLLFKYVDERNKKTIIPILVLILMIIAQAETIFLEPNTIHTLVTDALGNRYYVTTLLNSQVRCIHFFAFTFVITALFICVFVIPKKNISKKILIFSFYALFLAAFIILIYSIKHDNYEAFFKKLLFDNQLDFSGIEDTNKRIEGYAPVAVFGNKNVYGIFLEVCLFCALINYSLTKKKHNLVIASLFYIHLLISLCKAGIALASISILVYTAITLYFSFKEKNKFDGIVCFIILSIIMLLFIAFLILFFSNEVIRNKILYFKNSDSIKERETIWKTSLVIIGDTSFIYGAGYGIYDSILFNANQMTILQNTSITHNWILAIVGKGGIINLIPYIVLLAYSGYVIIKYYKYDRKVLLIVATSIITFFAHSFIEDNYIVVIGFISLLLIIKNTIDTKILASD